MRSIKTIAVAATLVAVSGAHAQDVVSNGSFETPGPGFVIAEDWGQFNNVFADESVEVTPQDGLRSIKMFGQFIPEGQSDNGMFQVVPVVGGASYTLTTHALSLASDSLQPFNETGSPGGGPFGHRAVCVVDFKDSGGNNISSFEVDMWVPGTSPNDVWVQAVAVGVAPANAVEAQVTPLLIQWDLATGAVFVDNISLVQEDAGPQPCNPADLAEPFGVLDFSDVIAFLGFFGAGCD